MKSTVGLPEVFDVQVGGQVIAGPFVHVLQDRRWGLTAGGFNLGQCLRRQSRQVVYGFPGTDRRQGRDSQDDGVERRRTGD